MFIEAYGQQAVQGRSFSPEVDAALAEGNKRLASAGFSSRSGFLNSATYGGISWLAHSSLQAGLWVNNQDRYNQLISAKRFTLAEAFKRAGWRTVDDDPSNDRPWPQGKAFYHFDQIYNRYQVGYHGPTFTYASMPDQYIFSALQRLELGKPHRKPLFAEVDTVSSHMPWNRIPQEIGWNQVGNGSIYNRIPMEHETGAFLGQPQARQGGVWAVDRVRAEHADLLRAALRQQESRDGRPRRPPAVADRQRPGLQSRRADLDHRPRPEGAAADRKLGLGPGTEAKSERAGVADERLPQPLPQRVRRTSVDALAAVSADQRTDPGRQRLVGLDGVRGLAALFVVVNHVFLRAFPGYPADHAPFWAGWFIYGRFAVVVFIVLSGFSLALSPARHGWRLDGVWQFARRRAWRILPPYWAALFFSLAVAWLVVPQPGQGMPGLKSVVANGLLVQNLAIVPSPNRAFWSMAVEAQLYVLFPLLLLVVRRWGAILMVATVTLVVAAVGIFGPHISRVDTFVVQSPPDLAALFALGILSAGIVRASRAPRSWPWPWLALGAALPVLATIWWQGSVWTAHHLLWVDLALGPAIACLLASLATGRPTPLLRLLDARPMRNLGLSSYSLYLTHAPIVVMVYELVHRAGVAQGVPAFVVSLALVLPLTITFARVFASAFEAPFRRHQGSSSAGTTGAHFPRTLRVPG